MKDLREKADPGPPATRFADAEGEVFVVETPALYDPVEISGHDEYPQYGDWLSCKDGYLECPRRLAQQLVDAVDQDDVSFPAVVEVESVRMVDEEWQVKATVEEAE